MDGWNTTFLLGSRPIFRCENVSFREGNPLEKKQQNTEGQLVAAEVSGYPGSTTREDDAPPEVGG